jgi:murein DD-endopeptidase MepM/ murein hydrolase activator NlpD
MEKLDELKKDYAELLVRSGINVQKGQHVRARTVLGSLGNDHTMQFQLRHWSSLLNPSHWLRR